MGHIYASIELSNPPDKNLKAIQTKSLVDTGALVLGETVLLDAIPVEDMDLVIHLAQLKLYRKHICNSSIILS